MENLTPKIDDALGAVFELMRLKKKHGRYDTDWGWKTEQGLKLSIINKLLEYGVVLREEKL